MTVLAAGLALAACASGPQLPAPGAAAAPAATAPAASAPASSAAAAASAGDSPSAAAVSGPQRDLSDAEKKAIMQAVAYNLKDPQAARYHWTKFPARTEEQSRNYCATVDAQSPFPAYNGKQAYIVEVRLANGQIVGATMGLIAGGKDVSIVRTMCAKYGLDPTRS